MYLYGVWGYEIENLLNCSICMSTNKTSDIYKFIFLDTFRRKLNTMHYTVTVPVSVLFLKRICCFFINPTKKPNQLGSAINKIRCLSFCRTNEWILQIKLKYPEFLIYDLFCLSREPSGAFKNGLKCVRFLCFECTQFFSVRKHSTSTTYFEHFDGLTIHFWFIKKQKTTIMWDCLSSV